MRKFKVTFKEVTTKTIEIEAENRDQVTEIALDMCNTDSIDMDKNFDDWCLDVDDIKEV